MRLKTIFILGILTLSLFAYSAVSVTAVKVDGRTCNIAGVGDETAEICIFFNPSGTTSHAKSNERNKGKGQITNKTVSLMANTTKLLSNVSGDPDDECEDIVNMGSENTTKDSAVVDFKADPNNVSDVCVTTWIGNERLNWTLLDVEYNGSSGFFSLRSGGANGWLDGLFFASAIVDTPSVATFNTRLDKWTYAWALDMNDRDKDDDGEPDALEIGNVRWDIEENGYAISNAIDDDNDEDGVSDYYERTNSQSNPQNSDTDGDGLTDDQEVSGGTYQECDILMMDSDMDGLTDWYEEVSIGSDCFNTDSDDDGIGDMIDDMECNAADSDSDGDGCSDYTEYMMGPPGACLDAMWWPNMPEDCYELE